MTLKGLLDDWKELGGALLPCLLYFFYPELSTFSDPKQVDQGSLEPSRGLQIIPVCWKRL